MQPSNYCIVDNLALEMSSEGITHLLSSGWETKWKKVFVLE